MALRVRFSVCIIIYNELCGFAEFRRYSGETDLIVFPDDMCVGKNTPQPANVVVGRLQRATSALQQAAIFTGKVRNTFSVNVKTADPKKVSRFLS